MTSAADRASLLVLSGLEEIGPARIRALVSMAGGASAALGLVRRSPSQAMDAAAIPLVRREATKRRWAERLGGLDEVEVLARHVRAGLSVLVDGDDGWPDRLVVDPEPPVMLVARGEMSALEGPAVAIVGTRRATAAGLRVAEQLGRDLTAAGVVVVSGLAAGIDGAAHRGVLDAGGRPVGVVGCGHDRVYPRQHRELWGAVGERGALLSEYPLGTRPERWRFPARNRIVAALASVVVVVESGVSGGSMTTVTEALNRDVTVAAVPGSVCSAASAGTNQLIFDGAHLVRDAMDVTGLLGISSAPAGARTDPDVATAPAPSDEQLRAIYDVVGAEVLSIEALGSALGCPPLSLVADLARLEAARWLVRDGAGYRRVLR